MSLRLRAAALCVLFLSFLPVYGAQVSKAKPFKRLGTQRSVDVSRLPKGEPGRQRGAKRVHRRPKLPRRTGGRSVHAVTRDASTPAVPVAPKAPVFNFEGLADDNTAIPPDTMGAVGNSHVLTALNTQFRIQNRSGFTLTTVAHDAFWGVTGAFDPKVLYDRDADRWIVVALDDAWSSESSVLIAVSDTADPTGTWEIHQLYTDQEVLGVWGDFPMIGFNGEHFVITLNMFQTSGAGNFVQSNVFVFDKTALYAGTIDGVYHTSEYDFCLAPAVDYDGGTGVVYLVEAGFGEDEIYLLSTDDESLDFIGTLHGPQKWYWWGGNFAPQAGGNYIDLSDDRMVNAVYQNGLLYASHTVFVPIAAPTQAAVQWWRFAPNLTNATQNRIVPPATASYAYPSIAVNEANDVLIGYSTFSPTQFASAAYSYRRSSDAPGVMSAPYVYKSGEANYYKTYGGDYNRWGDYSATMVDPIDDLTFWTIQEYAESPINSESQWGTWWAKVVAQPFGIPANFSATANGTTAVNVAWDAVGDVSYYDLQRSAGGAAYASIGGPLLDPRYTDVNVAANTTYLYRVRAVAAATQSGFSAIDPATTITFTNDPLNTGTAVKRAHVQELRTAVNAFRTAAGLTPFAFTDDPLALLGIIRATHIAQLQANLNAARVAVGLTPVSYTETVTTGMSAKKAHVTEIRSGVK